MMKQNIFRPSFSHEDFIIQVRPIVTTDKKIWTGRVVVHILTSDKNPLNSKDGNDIWHLCRMMCSLIPMMEYDSDLMEAVDDFAKTYKFDEGKGKDSLTIKSKEGNVIKLDWKSNIKGSA